MCEAAIGCRLISDRVRQHLALCDIFCSLGNGFNIFSNAADPDDHAPTKDCTPAGTSYDSGTFLGTRSTTGIRCDERGNVVALDTDGSGLRDITYDNSVFDALGALPFLTSLRLRDIAAEHRVVAATALQARLPALLACEMATPDTGLPFCCRAEALDVFDGLPQLCFDSLSAALVDGTCLDCCRNGVQDGDEDNLDCGGSTCPMCGVGDCNNGVRDGDELGVDCGGPTCAANCCANGVQDADETDVDCGGNDCEACVGGW